MKQARLGRGVSFQEFTLSGKCLSKTRLSETRLMMNLSCKDLLGMGIAAYRAAHAISAFAVSDPA
ncbi:hypothetical protein [Paracoccus jiaweipingae]|uniref:hypothetical protein n=1 Tax=unclassified Paracoccus (in: a-proteobacteria) TaxID=2688777 RepID=UPI0037AA8CC9